MEMGERKGEGREGSRERTGASRNFPSSTTKGDDLDSLGTHLEAKLPFEGIARAKGSAVVLFEQDFSPLLYPLSEFLGR